MRSEGEVPPECEEIVIHTAGRVAEGIQHALPVGAAGFY